MGITKTLEYRPVSTTNTTATVLSMVQNPSKRGNSPLAS
jgi:hypothetical protein